MSAYLNGLALRARVGGAFPKALLLFLTDRAADDTGLTGPTSLSYIAFGLEIGLTSVKKYRAHLGAGSPGKPGLGLISWRSNAGAGGEAIYRINVKALASLAEASFALYQEKLIGREATDQDSEQSRADQPDQAERSRGDQPTGSNGREATINLPFSLSNNLLIEFSEEEIEELTDQTRSHLQDEETQRFRDNGYADHPAVTLWCEKLHKQPRLLQLYSRELLVSKVKLTQRCLQAWSYVLEDYTGRPDWNPLAIKSLINRYERYITGELTREISGSTRRGTGKATKSNTGGLATLPGERAGETEPGGDVPAIPNRRKTGRSRYSAPGKSEWRRKNGLR